MGSTACRIAFAVAVALPAAFAYGIEYRSVKEPAILFDAPSEKGKRLFIVTPGTPVEVVVSLDKWVKVREPGGAISWIERRALGDQRTVMVVATRTAARQRAAASAPVAFEVIKDVVLELTGPPSDGWVPVRHKDGASGFLRVTEVWGL